MISSYWAGGNYQQDLGMYSLENRHNSSVRKGLLFQYRIISLNKISKTIP